MKNRKKSNNSKYSRQRKFIKWLIIPILFALILIAWGCNYIIVTKTNRLIFSNTTQIPMNKVGLLLGTSKVLRSGESNQYFDHRIKATVELYKAGKIKYIVVSGDNSKVGYNEPLDMKNELVRLGIPEEKIFLDYAGFRTYDSIIRMGKIFGQQRFTIISQEFHNRRAIYIANHFGYQTVGYCANDVDQFNGFKTNAREKIARIKVFIDFIMHKEPKFLGQKIIIE
jgi:SanA protein